MASECPAKRSVPGWYPGVLRRRVMDVAAKLAEHGLPVPPMTFFQSFATSVDDSVNGIIYAALTATTDDEALACLNSVRDLLSSIEDDVFLVAEAAADATIARLALYFRLFGRDGYNEPTFCLAWGAPNSEPEWGTIWGMHQKIRDFTPAFIFKICMRGDSRVLAVECHAPTRNLPEDPLDRLRARTLTISGVPVIAFSPNDIEADPMCCTDEISDALSILAQELLAMHGIGAPVRRDFRPRG